MLHNLLHIIINQLQLSSSFIEFHGARSATIESHIVNNHHRCGLEINEFEMKEEVDDATGNKLKRRREISGKETDKNDETIAKLFSVRNTGSQCEYPWVIHRSPFKFSHSSKCKDVKGTAYTICLPLSGEKPTIAENSEIF